MLQIIDNDFDKFDYSLEIKDFLKELKEHFIIIESAENQKFNDKWIFGLKSYNMNKYSKPLPVINTINIKIDNSKVSCSENLKFLCYSNEYHPVIGDKLSDEELYNLISKLRTYSLKNVVFVGGNPFNELDTIKNLHTIFPNLKFLIQVNLSDINDDYIDQIERAGINLIININDERKLSLLQKLIENKMICELIIINSPDINLQGLNCVNNVITNECNILTGNANIAVNTYNDDHNICMFGKLFIDYNGDIYPCLEFRNQTFGNLRTDEFGSILLKVEQQWENTDLQNKNCLNCNYSLNCNRCIMKKTKSDVHCTMFSNL
ncbi:MAG: SPASM domain-containing protein [Anaerorhabdus sp.]